MRISHREVLSHWRKRVAMLLLSNEKEKLKRARPQDAAARQPLQELRDALLDLHKTLIDSERTVYETNVGPIKSPHHFLQLLSSDPWFAWCVRSPS